MNQCRCARGCPLVLAQHFARPLDEALARFAIAQKLGDRQFKRIHIGNLDRPFLHYERLRQLIVTKVNNTPINDIKDLAEALKSPIEGIHKIEFNDHPKLIHVDAAQAEQDNKEFLPARYRITKLELLE